MFASWRPWLSLLAAGLFTLTAAQAAQADPVTFATTGVFSNIAASSGCAGNGTNEIQCADGRRLIYTANSISRDSAALPFHDNPLGSFLYVNLPPSSAVGPILPAGIIFTLSIDQLQPLPGSGAFMGTIQIDTSGVGDTNFLQFSTTNLSIDGINYHLLGFYFPSANMPSQVSAPVPEPATLLLLGTGLTAAVGVLKKRRARNPNC